MLFSLFPSVVGSSCFHRSPHWHLERSASLQVSKALLKADCFSEHHPTARHCKLCSTCLHKPPSRNSNCFDCLRDDDGYDNGCDAVATSNDSASDVLHAQPKASRSNAAPAGEGVLIPPHAGHASHATYACALSRSLEQTCKAAALLRSFSAAHPL
jgi:hypothetical protein